ncbi:hypothetical protein [Pleomorphovibrio marinus]|uniref:hypothetical protein n=1 Tax=Pleomorphovibrio marinus TaxID=2164132 RepID=UPI000E0A9AD3|nr:hypothetical protein [Pleomorphovibrio marinus]
MILNLTLDRDRLSYRRGLDEIEPAWMAVRHDEHVTHRDDYGCEIPPKQVPRNEFGAGRGRLYDR